MARVVRGPDGSIRNAMALTASDIVHERVVCPLCSDMVFEMWPEGWDAHAEHRCRGVSGATVEERKADFKRLTLHLFR
jgi:hypothetical protein